MRWAQSCYEKNSSALRRYDKFKYLPKDEDPRTSHGQDDVDKISLNGAVISFWKHKVGVFLVIKSPARAYKRARKRKNDLEHENVEDSWVGHCHHFWNFVDRFGAVHLNFGLGTRVNDYTYDTLCIAKRHSSEKKVFSRKRDLSYVSWIDYQLVFLLYIHASVKLVNQVVRSFDVKSCFKVFYRSLCVRECAP